MGKGLSGIQSIIDGVAITTQVNSDQTPLMCFSDRREVMNNAAISATLLFEFQIIWRYSYVLACIVLSVV